MKSYKIFSTDLVCLKCGNICSIMRKVGREKSLAHIKDLWCYRCKGTTHHYEVKDVSTFMWKKHNSKDEKIVEELIKNGREEQCKTVKLLKKIP